MSNIDITELAIKAKGGDRKAKDKLASIMYKKADCIARSYANKIAGGENYIDDYKNEAMIGMIESLNSYDSTKGSFLSYSDYAMRQGVRDYLNFKQRVISQPKNITEKISKYRRIVSKSGESITDDDIQRETGYSLKVINNIKRAIDRDYVYSLDVPVGEDEGISLVNTIDDDYNLEDSVIDKIEVDMVWNGINKLKEKDRMILFSSFGAWGYKKKNTKELGAMFGVSSVSICNYRKSIIEEIRKEVS